MEASIVKNEGCLTANPQIFFLGYKLGSLILVTSLSFLL